MRKSIRQGFMRQMRGRPFRNTRLEQEFGAAYYLSGVRTGYVFSLMAALSFVVFSCVEYFAFQRPMNDTVQVVRAGLIMLFFAIGWHAKVHTEKYEKNFHLIAPALMVVYVSGILFFEYRTQLEGHPEFFYLSVNSTCILLTIACYYFMRLPISIAVVLSLLLAALTVGTVYASGVFNVTVVGRMLTYISVSNAVGFWIRRMFDMRERRIFLQTKKLKNVAALKQRLIEAETAANRTKTQFMAMLSHEIRTPMHTVTRLMAVMQKDFDGQLSEKRLKTFQQVEQACDQLLATLDDLLHYAMLGGTSRDEVDVEFRLDALLAECVQMVDHSRQEKGLKFDMDVEQVAGKVFVGQPHKLKRVVLNLLVNAIKFTDHGEIRLEAALHPLSLNQQRMTLSVTDTGIGIPETELQSIFQPFYQVDSSYARRFRGSGLGLSICQELMKSIGGAIAVKSEPGVGSVFEVTFPLTSYASTA
jgi:signal transduction histidine kinase